VRVLGIDPGSRHCGFGVVEGQGGRLKHVAHGVLSLREGAIEARLFELHEGLARTIAEHRPQLVAVEDVFSKHARSALVLGQARGVALLAAAQAKLEVRAFPPSTIKQLVTGSGRAEKEQVGRMVGMLLGVSIQVRADASDALAAAICGVLRAGQPQQDEVLKLLKARRK
jgi:crossover junction endodeoxyribonuclease RuvC